VIIYGEDMLRLDLDPETDEPNAYAGSKKLTLPEYVYGLSVERIASYIVVKVGRFYSLLFQVSLKNVRKYR